MARVPFLTALNGTLQEADETLAQNLRDAIALTDGALTASRAVVTDADGKLTASDVTATEISYLDGVTSSVQAQINAKAAKGANSDITSLTGLTTPLSLAQGGTNAITAPAAATSLGVGTGNSPQFTAVNIGHATDTTIARSSAGVITVEGVEVTLNTLAQTLAAKTLTSPTINDGALSGTFSGSHTYSGTITVSGAIKGVRNTAITALNYAAFEPTDRAAGKPGLYLVKNIVATQWDISLNDTVNNAGTINFDVGTLSLNGSPVMSRGATETITGTKTFNALVTAFAAAGNTSLEIGRTDGVSSTPYIDWHSGATAVDYDARIIVSGGTGVAGGGTINVACATLTHNTVELARVDGPVFTLPPRLPTYTVATVPSAATYVRGEIYVSNETGGAVPAFSDGTNWRRVTDRAIVS